MSTSGVDDDDGDDNDDDGILISLCLLIVTLNVAFMNGTLCRCMSAKFAYDDDDSCTNAVDLLLNIIFTRITSPYTPNSVNNMSAVTPAFTGRLFTNNMQPADDDDDDEEVGRYG